MLKLLVNATVIHLQVGFIGFMKGRIKPYSTIGLMTIPNNMTIPPNKLLKAPLVCGRFLPFPCTLQHLQLLGRAITLNSPSICSQVQQT